MTAVERFMHADPDQVWAVLSDGWLYPLWVVGASRMRDVDESWPAPGARLHHSVGSWPVLVDDTTSVVEADPPRRIRLQARAWPAGEADVEIGLVPMQDGTMVTMDEDVASGPGLLVPKPARAALVKWRNTEALRRLCLLVENRETSNRVS